MAKKTKEINDTLEEAEDFDESIYKIMEKYIVNTSKGVKEEMREVFKPEYNNHIFKCKFRTAKKFNIPVKHLMHAYQELNGKKIDDIYINDLLDRYGINDGKQLNRVDLAARYKRLSIVSIDIAEKKLKKIIKSKDVVTAYMNYISEFKDELDKKFDDNVIYGETK